MSPRFRSALIVAALAGAPAIAMADLSQTDRDFIEQAAMGGHEEVSSGQSAAESEARRPASSLSPGPSAPSMIAGRGTGPTDRTSTAGGFGVSLRPRL